MINVITDCRPGEPDILTGVSKKTLAIKSLDSILLMSFAPPAAGWTHEDICATCSRISKELLEDGADAYLGRIKVGSTEI